MVQDCMDEIGVAPEFVARIELEEAGMGIARDRDAVEDQVDIDIVGILDLDAAVVCAGKAQAEGFCCLEREREDAALFGDGHSAVGACGRRQVDRDTFCRGYRRARARDGCRIAGGFGLAFLCFAAAH